MATPEATEAPASGAATAAPVITPSPTPFVTPTHAVYTPTPSPTPVSYTPVATVTATRTPTATATAAVTPTRTPVVTATATRTPTPTATATQAAPSPTSALATPAVQSLAGPLLTGEATAVLSGEAETNAEASDTVAAEHPGRDVVAVLAARRLTAFSLARTAPRAAETEAGTPAPAAAASPTPVPAPTPDPTPVPTSEYAGSHIEVMDSVRYAVDFDYLQTVNRDIKGWLIQDGTNINYPVLQTTDNTYYRKHLFNRNTSRTGSVFMDSASSAAVGAPVADVFGNDNGNNTMFASLSSYADQAYYDAHPQMILLTPYGDYSVDLFAAYACGNDDDEGWRIAAVTSKAAFAARIRSLQENSLFTADESATPEWGDQLLALVTCPSGKSGKRYVVYGRIRQILYATADSVTVTKLAMDRRETISGWEEVPGRGEMMVYAQNDPLWKSMRYENLGSTKKRTLGDGGCGPTSVAMAVANLVPRERLADICAYAKSELGFTFNARSVNEYYCDLPDAQYQVQTAEEYMRYLPVVMAGFATGNNQWGLVSRSNVSGTSLGFLKKVAYLYKLDLVLTSDDNKAVEAVKAGRSSSRTWARATPSPAAGITWCWPARTTNTPII